MQKGLIAGIDLRIAAIDALSPWSTMLTVLKAGSSSWVNHRLMMVGGCRKVLPTAGLA